MSFSVLVAYATRYGSTLEVAETVAATLREDGLKADVQKAQEVRSLAGYNAVILGAPLYISSLEKEARNFLSRHREALAKLPVAIFALGPIHSDEKELQGSRAQLDKELARFPWLAPAGIAVFAGKYDPVKLRFPDSLVAKLPASPIYQVPLSDVRDWAAIRAWAASLPALFQSA